MSERPNKRLKLTAPVVYGTIAFVNIRTLAPQVRHIPLGF